jgi:DNA mismatch repair protein MutS2
LRKYNQPDKIFLISNLEYEETEEINRILKQYNEYPSVFLPLIQYQEFLSDIDVIAAKAKYANRINGHAITNNRRLYFRDAYHPILYLNNKQKQEITHPQTIELQQENRIIVISGPNAGGKTISLKNSWTTQLMLRQEC